MGPRDTGIREQLCTRLLLRIKHPSNNYSSSPCLYPVRGHRIDQTDEQPICNHAGCLRHSVDLLGESGLLTSSSVLVDGVVGSSLVDGLGSNIESSLSLVSIACSNSSIYLTDSSLYAVLLSNILCMTLCILLYTEDRSFNIRHEFHLLAENYLDTLPRKT